ncbi:MAG: undecaprenyl-phosphate glucose phosphotransferase [Pseudomonadota bacterium]|nr:undecaprenyl-phosphate glucose phosphotransferase [Pseudomonadota bacterium]
MDTSTSSLPPAARQSRRFGIIASSPSILLGLARLFDLVLILVAGWAAYWMRHGSPELPVPYLVAIGIGMVVAANAFQVAGLYNFDHVRNPAGQFTRLAGSWITVAMLLIVAGFFSKTSADYSRIWLATWLVLSFLSLAGFRIALSWRIVTWQRDGILVRNVVIVGHGEPVNRLVRHVVSAPPEFGVRLLGVFNDLPDAAPLPPDTPVLGDADDLMRYLREASVQEVVVAVPWSEEERIGKLLDRLREVPVDVTLAPEPFAYRMMDRRIEHLSGLPLTVVQERPLAGWNYIIKGVEDRLLALLILILISPLMAVIAILIRLDSPGPALFRQQRYGFNNNVFTVYKFRSMRNDAGDSRGGRQATKGDPRITRIGAFIRKTSLDELPQIFNVLQGDMSLVGPRPHAVAHNEEYAGIIDQYLGRHKVKPGITGWAQIHGLRGETDTPEKMAMRVQYDLYYIDNWSLWLDLKILFRTIFVGFVHRNAY